MKTHDIGEQVSDLDEEWKCLACAIADLGQKATSDGEVLLSVSLDIPCPDGEVRSLTVAVVPVLFIKRSDRVHSFVWCPACQKEHAYGHGDGHRVAHCPPGSPFDRTGYFIRTPKPDASLAQRRV